MQMKFNNTKLIKCTGDTKNMSNIIKKCIMNIEGILEIDGTVIGIEDTDTGKFYNLQDLLVDFKDKFVKLSIKYDEDYK